MTLDWYRNVKAGENAQQKVHHSADEYEQQLEE